VGLPMQMSQCPHGFKHACTCSHGWHFVGSPTLPSVQLPFPLPSSDPSHTGVGAPGITQHPKQSQPCGVRGPQYDKHWADCIWKAVVQVNEDPEICALGLYAHLFPSG